MWDLQNAWQVLDKTQVASYQLANRWGCTSLASVLEERKSLSVLKTWCKIKCLKSQHLPQIRLKKKCLTMEGDKAVGRDKPNKKTYWMNEDSSTASSCNIFPLRGDRMHSKWTLTISPKSRQSQLQNPQLFCYLSLRRRGLFKDVFFLRSFSEDVTKMSLATSYRQVWC